MLFMELEQGILCCWNNYGVQLFGFEAGGVWDFIFQTSLYCHGKSKFHILCLRFNVAN